MAREKRKIKCISYCYVGDTLTPVSELNEEQKERLAVGIGIPYLNELFKGRAVISPPSGFELGHDQHGRITVTRVPVQPEQA